MTKSNQWSLCDGDFDYADFFLAILQLFDLNADDNDPDGFEDDWAHETLEWLNRYRLIRSFLGTHILDVLL